VRESSSRARGETHGDRGGGFKRRGEDMRGKRDRNLAGKTLEVETWSNCFTPGLLTEGRGDSCKKRQEWGEEEDESPQKAVPEPPENFSGQEETGW